MKKQRLRGLVLLVAFLVVAVFGISRLHIQSVDSYSRDADVYEGEDGHEIIVESEPQEVAVVTATEVGKMTAENSASPDAMEKSEEADEAKDALTTAVPEAGEKKADAGADSQSSSKTKKSNPPKNTPKATKKKNQKNRKKEKEKNSTKKPSGSEEEKAYVTCTFSIRCDSLVDHKEELAENLWQYVPEDGVILADTQLKVEEGTNAYEALSVVCQKYGIQLDAEYSKAFGTNNVRGNGHLYVKAAGDMSGWMYKVNQKIPNVGASKYVIEEGDMILWGYSRDGRSIE